MKLEVHERIALLGLMPKEGGYAALKEYRRAREMLSFTAEELKFYELESVPDPATGKAQTHWSPQKAAEAVKDCPVTEYMTSEFRKILADLERKGKLTDETFSLYEKFVVIYQ